MTWSTSSVSEIECVRSIILPAPPHPFSPPYRLFESMRQQMDAERKARALVLEAEGEARATVRVAEGIREAAVIRAQGEAQALLLKAQADSKYLERIGSEIDSEKASDVLIAMKYIEGFDTISEGSKDTDRTTIFMPNSAAGLYATTGREADQA